MNISVIVPSFNRAKLLPITLPTYLQEDVIELIVVDDCSTDNTKEVVLELQKKYPNIRYIRNEKNSKQTFSKNVGIGMAKGNYVYWGDDDSVLYPDAIHFLKETIIKTGAQICGAKALYLPLEYDNRIEEYVEIMDTLCPKDEVIADIRTVTAHFIYSTPAPIEVPFCHACALVEKELAQKNMFDVNYIGNAYREETDFFIRCLLSGAKIMYDSRAVQINLPRQMTSGGAHSMGRVRWYMNTIRNNWYFLKKNGKAIQKHYGFKENLYKRQMFFAIRTLKNGAISALKLLFR